MTLPVMPAGLVLDSRNDLLERLLYNDAFRRQLSFMMASQVGSVPAFMSLEKSRAADIEAAVKKYMPMNGVMANLLKVAEVYRVSPDMSAMVEFAASQLDDSDVLDRSLAPTQCGIVRFDKPLGVKDIRGKMMLVHWLVWGPVSDQHGNSHTGMWAFNDAISQPDDIHLEMYDRAEQSSASQAEWYNRMVGRFATVGFDYMRDGEPLGAMETMPSERQAAEVLNEGFEPLPGTNPVRYIHALWLLLGQTVTKIEDDQADRPARRRAGKAKLPAKVTVIRLRREVSTLDQHPGESQVEWQHRWIVRGHWRWQACGAGRAERRRIWINPFIKGPEGAPIRQSEKVYSLDR